MSGFSFSIPGPAGSPGPTGPMGPTGPTGPPAVGTARLSFVSATQLQLGRGVIPLKVGGAWTARVLTTGVTLGNGGLANATLYYVYAWDNAGVTTLDASTTTHATDPDYGVEIKAGDPTRTLVGMAMLSTGSFVDNPAARFVRSWYRDTGVAGQNVRGVNTATSSGTFGELLVALRTEFLAWSQEPLSFAAGGSFVVNSGGVIGNCQAQLDGPVYGTAAQAAIATTGPSAFLYSWGATQSASEGYRYVAFFAATSAGTTTFLANYHGTSVLTTGRP